MVWDWFPTEHAHIDAQLMARALEVAEQIGTPWDQLWTRISHTQYLTQLGQYEQVANLNLGLLPQLRQQFPATEVSMVESNCCWSLCMLGRYREAAELGRQALHLVDHPDLARWVWLHATENLCCALLELGEWDEAETLLAPARDLNLAGVSAIELNLVAGLIHSHRGDTTAAQSCLASARSKLPSAGRGFEDTARSWLRWVSAQVAASHGDFSAAVRHLEPLWEMTDRQLKLEHLWRSLLLAARVEADHAAQASRRRRDKSAAAARQRLREIRRVSNAVKPIGRLGKAWTTQLDAELNRVEGRTDLGLWQAAADAWAGRYGADA
jgi:tetratricopeptide (TPR) repeat protein